MGYDKTSDNPNKYFQCRKEAARYNEKLSSREGAAELLGCSPSSLADYELGLTKFVPPDRVCKMADLYNAPELKSSYCLEECPIGHGLPISCQIKTIEHIAIQLNRRLSPATVARVKENLLDIAEDGKITEEELPKLQGILDELTRLQKGIDDLRLLAEKQLKGWESC